MVPLLNVGHLLPAQYEDIKGVLRSNRVAFVESNHEPLPTYLCVKDKDYERAHRLVQDEYRSFALAEHTKWKHQWNEFIGVRIGGGCCINGDATRSLLLAA